MKVKLKKEIITIGDLNINPIKSVGNYLEPEEWNDFLQRENVTENVHVVGNTIVEVAKPYILTEPKREDMILLDVHRPENFKYKDRLKNIIDYANKCIDKFNLPVKMLNFSRTTAMMKKFNIDLGKVELIDLLAYKEYLHTLYHCKFIISDSGTAQEEPAMFNTPVVVPRDFTERPQSIRYDCSHMLNVNSDVDQGKTFNSSLQWLSSIEDGTLKMNTEWLGEGNTGDLVVKHLYDFLMKK